MIQEKIIKKLNVELSKDIKNECQVVYILSQIRKLLDIRGTGSYRLIRFYCNWSLHVGLDKPRTTKIISEKFDRYIDITKNGKYIINKIKSECPNFFKLNDFKDELKRFFQNNNLPLNLLNKNKNWIKFIKFLLEIIGECPVVCVESSDKIRKLILEKDNKVNYSYKFSLVGSRHKPIIKLKFK